MILYKSPNHPWLLEGNRDIAQRHFNNGIEVLLTKI